jgi:hypothetical protein
MVCRRHDLFVLASSGMGPIIDQLGYLLAHGDSAYVNGRGITSGSANMSVVLRRALSGTRESVEWGYKKVKVMFKILRNTDMLRIMDGFQRVSNIIDLCFLLTNFLNCFDHNQTSQFFDCIPPSFENYMSQGPRAVI